MPGLAKGAKTGGKNISLHYDFIKKNCFLLLLCKRKKNTLAIKNHRRRMTESMKAITVAKEAKLKVN